MIWLPLCLISSNPLSFRILRTSQGFIGVNLGISQRDFTLCPRQLSSGEVGQMRQFDLRRILDEWTKFWG